ncbi:MAG: hypothetical protein R3F20_15280 [Planctomycetota bacterium]
MGGVAPGRLEPLDRGRIGHAALPAVRGREDEAHHLDEASQTRLLARELFRPRLGRVARPVGLDARRRLGRARPLRLAGLVARDPRLALRPPPLVASAAPARRGADESDDERQQGQGAERTRHPVATHELPQPVDGAGGSGRDRFVGEVAPQVVGEGGGGRVAAFGLLLERAPGDRLQVAAEARIDRSEPAGFAVSDRLDGRVEIGSLQRVGQGSREEGVEEETQRVDVAPRVDPVGIAQGLLGTHPGDRADEPPGTGGEARRAQLRIGDAGHAEVEDARAPLLVDEDVGGLQVAVDDALLVRVLDAVRELGRERDPAAEIRPRLVRPVEQRSARDELHRDPGDGTRPGLMDARAEHAREARVVQRPENPRLELEAPDDLLAREAVAQDLQGDVAPGRMLPRAKDRAHPAPTEQSPDLEVVDAVAGGDASDPTLEPGSDEERRGLAEDVDRFRVRGDERLEASTELRGSATDRLEPIRAGVAVESHQVLEVAEEIVALAVGLGRGVAHGVPGGGGGGVIPGRAARARGSRSIRR